MEKKKRIVVNASKLVDMVLPRELAYEWADEEGNLILLKDYDLKLESIDRAIKDGIKNAENDKVLIVCTDQAGSTHKLILLRNFLGFAHKSGVKAVVKDGSEHIINPNLYAMFRKNKLSFPKEQNKANLIAA